MSTEATEKTGVPPGTVVDHDSEKAAYEFPQERPTGWLYQERKFGPIKLPYYASPISQLLIVAFVCFLCPGMFNALSGLGGAGQLDATVADDSTVALYSTFASVAFFSGTICNKIGIKATLSFGGFGYALYSASFLAYNHTHNRGFVIFAGALLGVCAGLLWCAQGAIMMSYPSEKMKGRYISVFWMIFNLGAVIGSLVPLVDNLENKSGNVGDGTYIGFLVLMGAGAVLGLFLLDSNKIIRKDGSKVISVQQPTWKSELWGLWEVLRAEPWILALFPMFFSSNYFYSYQFNAYNLARFTTRTRSLNSLLYWLSQIIGAGFMGLALDTQRLSRVTRARAGLAFVFVITLAIWGGGYAFQRNYTRASAKVMTKIDWHDHNYGGPLFLYMCYGLYDAIWQTYVYWIMGALSNNSRKLAIYAGFYKGIQSAGSAITFRLDSLEIPYINMFGSTWGLLLGSLVCAAPIIFMRIREHIPASEDIKFSDETESVEKFEQKQ
ncbi:hypothetical protein H072_9551 [Dactylellina haptotyla CBS 200.50]|uniref:Major facilitator superfamily (MFS) profile domain-containing protein n=1 Tax=Dactylellina haptotyla (strain CBS 200.50) TaxID=1284197 RepID=S8A1U8_DACHA|nr:hypothetical protein H072_9551 [Dactylellina haptotyla CBS 200.50]